MKAQSSDSAAASLLFHYAQLPGQRGIFDRIIRMPPMRVIPAQRETDLSGRQHCSD